MFNNCIHQTESKLKDHVRIFVVFQGKTYIFMSWNRLQGHALVNLKYAWCMCLEDNDKEAFCFAKLVRLSDPKSKRCMVEALYIANGLWSCT